MIQDHEDVSPLRVRLPPRVLTLIVCQNSRKSKMDEVEFNKWLDDHGVRMVEEFVHFGEKQISFIFCGVHKSRASFNQTAIDDLEKFHNIDARGETRRLCKESLEEELEKAAMQFVTTGDADNFFKYFNFKYLEDLVGKYPKLIYDVANYEKFKPKEKQKEKQNGEDQTLPALP